MAEVQARSQAPSSRGRGGGRGGRAGFGSRGPANRRTNGDKFSTLDATSLDDDGDVSQLRKQYGLKLDTIKELFPTWSDADILYALKETDGDVEVAATRIADGTISQWGEVSKPKKTTTRPKAKEPLTVSDSGNSRPVRGGRSDFRGGRARGTERGRGTGRGRATAHPPTNGHQSKDNHQLSVPTEESADWKTGAANDDATTSAWGTTESTTETTATPPATVPTTSTTDSAPAKPTVIPQNTQKTWASMLRQSTAPKPTPKPKEVPTPKPAEPIEPLPPAEPTAPEPEPQPAPEEPVKEVVENPPVVEPPKVVEPEVALPPPEDDLTRVNLEQLPDASNPIATNTAASTTADSWDPRQPQPSASVTPLSASQAQHQTPRPAASGYATTAIKATERPAPRMPSYQKRLLEQEEAVRMPGNREVDRAAVQFGAFSLNGGEEDIDGDREDPETRTQPPPESPVAAPRASLPPVSQPAAVPEAFPPAQKPAASLPPAPGTAATPVAPPTGPAATVTQPPQAPANQQFGRFSQTNTQEPAGFPQKPYDSFGQQTATTSAGLDSFPTPTTQTAGPPTTGAFSSAPSEYSSYYSADPQGRNSYNNYYAQQYGQQQQQQQQQQQHGGQNHHETSNPPNRAFGGYNAGQNDNLSQYPQSGAQQTRYGAAASAESHNSGHNTPNPIGQGGQQATGQTNQPQSNLHQQPHTNQYPYSHPYYSSPYYAQYMSQYSSGYGQSGYGGGPYGKGGLYGQPHQYGMSPQGPYDHASSPATSGFAQSTLGARETGLGSGIDNYGRAGSAQSGAPGGLGTSGFGGMHDTFGRGSAYPSQAGQSFNSPNAPASSTAAGNDDLKPYGDTKAAGGPSPSLAAAARPGSATNTTPAGTGLPPPQSAQQGMGGYGGYPSHMSHSLHGNQSAGSYGIGGAAGQGHGNGPYGSYGGNQAFGAYYGRQQQQQQGWGGNYH
ncbi:uncharacterized protein GGS22DRAFT_153665 [Annulohypoxylon maeteangense]|uniref:uncharacterized protein n=1 Tax=Annulohypoxylon maeteangense TaxID=1927788 RepID=UPI00200793DC|nr:uncharacterized protein GGS22DRAFT_153665 [Annulohypoxylon maeteangense]KAI0889337.1 hypothetical protein GGS22DRAFT_153665 [Annulohypoxylon maeteangense]